MKNLSFVFVLSNNWVVATQPNSSKKEKNRGKMNQRNLYEMILSDFDSIRSTTVLSSTENVVLVLSGLNGELMKIGLCYL